MKSTAPGAPLFVSLEGLDGSGKTTQIVRVADFYEKRNPKGVVVTREPGGTEVGERIRNILLEHGSLHPQTELLLLFAARVQHIKTVVAPALALGKTVVCDRYQDATYAYQGYGRGLGVELIDGLSDLLAVPLPDLTLYFDVPVSVALGRRVGRSADRIEAEGEAFFERVREGYQARVRAQPDRFVVIPAAGSLAEVAQAVDTALMAHL
jgi:dTMP kinase